MSDATRATRSPPASTTRWSSRPRPAPARRPSWSAASSRILADGRAEVGRDRRGDVHREGRRRAEAAAARGARPRADALPRDDEARRKRLDARAHRPRRGARQHHPRLLRRPAARASGRSGRRSALRGADRARPRGSSTRRSAAGCRSSSPDPPEGVRRALRRSRLRRRRWADRAAAAGRLGAGAVARLHGRVDAAGRSIASGEIDAAARGAPRVRGADASRLVHAAIRCSPDTAPARQAQRRDSRSQRSLGRR